MPKQRRSAKTEEQITAAAMRLFSEKGFSSVTMQEIADEAGIGKGTLYYHTPGKDELGLLVLQNRAKNLLEDVRNVSSQSARVEERLVDCLDVLVSFLNGGQEFLDMLIPEMKKRHTKVSRRIDKMRLAYLAILETLLAEGTAAGVIRSDLDPRVASRAMLGMLVGFHMHAKRFGEASLSQNSRDQLLAILLEGLLAKENDE